MSDVLDAIWCCMACSSKFRMGELIAVPGANEFGVGCPKCRSGDLQRAGGETVAVPEYRGEIGTIN